MKWIRMSALLLLVALVAAACGSESPEAGGDQDTAPEATSPTTESENGGGKGGGKQNGDQAEPEDLAPDFSVATFDGDTFKLSAHRGMPVVLNFWESW
jgi:ABC-type glycerol-3-phosphate transport system substrate-binding protein